MNLDRTDEEYAGLMRLSTQSNDVDRFLFATRLDPLRAILEKRAPQPVREPLLSPSVYVAPKAAAAERRHR